MNKSFFQLEKEKYCAIINAGFRVFSQNSYKKCPVSEIAEEAGISKSLLFYYFRNKKELYLFLLKYSVEVTQREMEKQACYDNADFFAVFLSGVRVKADIMKNYPDLAMFQLKAQYEKYPEVVREITALIGEYSGYEAQADKLGLNSADFIEGLDLGMMYRDIYLASQGYLWEKLQSGDLDPDKMLKDYEKMIAFWRGLYLRK